MQAKQYVTTENDNNRALLVDVTQYFLFWTVRMQDCLCDRLSPWRSDRLIVEGEQMNLSAGRPSDCLAVTNRATSRSLPHRWLTISWCHGSAGQKKRASEDTECRCKQFRIEPLLFMLTKGACWKISVALMTAALIECVCSMCISPYCLDFSVHTHTTRIHTHTHTCWRKSSLQLFKTHKREICLQEATLSWIWFPDRFPAFFFMKAGNPESRRRRVRVQVMKSQSPGDEESQMSAVKMRFTGDTIQNHPQTKFNQIPLFLWA